MDNKLRNHDDRQTNGSQISDNNGLKSTTELIKQCSTPIRSKYVKQHAVGTRIPHRSIRLINPINL